MSQSIFSGDFIDVTLGQMGASKIKTVNGQQHVVYFDLGEGKELVYVFSVTNENRCYLQRAKPYPMVQVRFASTEETLQYIEKDVEAFRNAHHSKKYEEFVDIAHKTIALTQRMEDLFITHNISHEDMALLQTETDRLTKLMEEIHSRSPEVNSPNN